MAGPQPDGSADDQDVPADDYVAVITALGAATVAVIAAVRGRRRRPRSSRGRQPPAA